VTRGSIATCSAGYRYEFLLAIYPANAPNAGDSTPGPVDQPPGQRLGRITAPVGLQLNLGALTTDALANASWWYEQSSG
jgi:hypothetical protein